MSEQVRYLRAEDLSAVQRETLAAGRLWAARAAPYLASAVLALRPLIVEGGPPTWDLSTFPVDPAWHIYLDVRVLDETPVSEIGFWHLHQAAHLLRRHERRCPLPEGAHGPQRGQRTEPQMCWNAACDAEIDDDLAADLQRAGHALPARALLPEHLQGQNGQLAETYFHALTENGPQPDLQAGDCGSGVDGQPRPWECNEPGITPLEAKLLAADTARRIRERSRTRGDTPSGWQRWADEVLEPIVDWRRQLAVAVRRGLAVANGRVDYSYARPSRRAAAVPQIVLPTMRKPVPKVAVVVDTSGSMSDGMLGQCLAEVGGLLRRVGASSGRDSVRLISCDAQAYEAQRVLDVRAVQLLGGGGTDMGAGLAAAVELRPRPDVVIVLTDGHTPWPASPPLGCEVVVALLDESGSVPGWATPVVVDVREAGGPR